MMVRERCEPSELGSESRLNSDAKVDEVAGLKEWQDARLGTSGNFLVQSLLRAQNWVLIAGGRQLIAWTLMNPAGVADL